MVAAVNNEIVILLHGLIRSAKSMRRLACYLQKNGYETHCYDYPSTKYAISEHGTYFQNFLENLLHSNPNKKFHFITHSLGGIIARETLSKLSQEKLHQCHCLVMLAPPNQGSALAKFCLKVFPFIPSFIKPLEELSCDQEAYIHQVTVPKNMKIGTIAGRFDAKVPPSFAWLKEQKDFAVINSTHTFIMNHPKARKYILNFLQYGIFKD